MAVMVDNNNHEIQDRQVVLINLLDKFEKKFGKEDLFYLLSETIECPHIQPTKNSYKDEMNKLRFINWVMFQDAEFRSIVMLELMHRIDHENKEKTEAILIDQLALQKNNADAMFRYAWTHYFEEITIAAMKALMTEEEVRLANAKMEREKQDAIQQLEFLYVAFSSFVREMDEMLSLQRKVITNVTDIQLNSVINYFNSLPSNQRFDVMREEVRIAIDAYKAEPSKSITELSNFISDRFDEVARYYAADEKQAKRAIDKKEQNATTMLAIDELKTDYQNLLAIRNEAAEVCEKIGTGLKTALTRGPSAFMEKLISNGQAKLYDLSDQVKEQKNDLFMKLQGLKDVSQLEAQVQIHNAMDVLLNLDQHEMVRGLIEVKQDVFEDRVKVSEVESEKLTKKVEEHNVDVSVIGSDNQEHKEMSNKVMDFSFDDEDDLNEPQSGPSI